MAILYLTYPLSAVAIVTLALGLGVWITRKFQLDWRLYWIGGAIFILSQVFHIPFNVGLTILFRRRILSVPPTAWLTLFNAVILGLSAGLFEEFARYVVFRWWTKDARSWRKGLLLGAGHGGMEALIIGLLVLYTFIRMIALRGVDLSTIVLPNQLITAQEQITAYWSATWYQSLLPAVERLFTLVCQVSLAVIVLQAFTRRQIRWLWLAVLWHACLDASAVYSVSLWGIYITEGIVGICALVSLIIIFLLRQPEPVEIPIEKLPIPKLTITPVEVEETAEKLDNTRYN